MKKLRQSLLAKAFRDELAQQDPDDETASVLVQRMGLQLEHGKTKSRGKHRNKGVPSL